MGYRVVLFGDTEEQARKIADFAEKQGVTVVAIGQSDTVWDRQSSILDFHRGAYPQKTNSRHVRIIQTQLGNKLGAVVFGDLERLTLEQVWGVLAILGSGSLFERTLEGMREVGARFSDWDLTLSGQFPEWLPMRACNIMREHGVSDLAILARLKNPHIAALPGLGDSEYYDAVVTARNLAREELGI